MYSLALLWITCSQLEAQLGTRCFVSARKNDLASG